MKRSMADMYNVAWFKIADCVARGEKERALGIYRLLAHSLSDTGLVAQLEGDILLFFNKEEALVKYQVAADDYLRAGHMGKAACVYEHMLTLTNNNNEYRKVLIELYTQLQQEVKVIEHTTVL